ncbi:peptidoglycan recognition protein family protein [Clostridium cadaveris]|uniref:peptidoglycan recognition protein family protein n=1 Tax=Clostridium cadaveris TaxID=1529 RepID=UPI001FABB04C|nr:N-acetylmuramoyl-L-alanine amidase [Clostridium cadaveris]
MLPINKQLISINYSKGVTISPKYIVIHDTDNRDRGATAQANRNYFANHPNAQASAHYIVDDENIIQCLEDTWRGWHIGDRYSGVNPDVPEANNGNSIGIEICVNRDGDFNKAMTNSIDLVKYLMNKHGIDVDHVIRHKDATGKNCPRKIIEEGLWGWYKSQLTGEVSTPPIVESKPQSNLEKATNFVGSRCRELQEKLIQLGYNCGGYGADGIFGQGTYDSLVSFQNKYCTMVDGLAGEETFRKLQELVSVDNGKSNWVESLQQECNNQGYSNQKVDGYPGPNTLAGCPLVKPGAQGNITKLIQERLISLGYNVSCGADGIFGNGTKQAVMQFQQDNGLSADGIVGRNTWRALLGL